jgi:phage gp36-like protein
MAWITLSEDNVTKGRLAASELSQVSAIANQGDTIAALIPQISRLVCGYVARRVPLGAAGTIPEELADAAAVIIVWKFVSQLPSRGLATEARQEAYKDAMKLLRDVAAGDFVVAPPDTQADVQPTSPSPAIECRPRKFTERTMDGI